MKPDRWFGNSYKQICGRRNKMTLEEKVEKLEDQMERMIEFVEDLMHMGPYTKDTAKWLQVKLEQLSLTNMKELK
jgi:hypothetical protein